MTISRRVLEELFAHARDAAPLECCGVLIGRGMSIARATRSANLADRPTVRFLLDPQTHFTAIRSARAHGLDVVGFYHSHPASAAYPSETDLVEWHDPELVSVIVSLKGGVPGARLFSRRSDVLTELPLTVVLDGED